MLRTYLKVEFQMLFWTSDYHYIKDSLITRGSDHVFIITDILSCCNIDIASLSNYNMIYIYIRTC